MAEAELCDAEEGMAVTRLSSIKAEPQLSADAPSAHLRKRSADAAIAELTHSSSMGAKWVSFVMSKFVHNDMPYDSVWHMYLLVQILMVVPLFALAGICVSAPYAGLTGFTSKGEVRAQHLVQIFFNIALILMCFGGMLQLKIKGLTTTLKVCVLWCGIVYCIASSVVWRTAPFQLLLIPLVEVAHILATPEDGTTMEILASLMVFLQLVFLAVYLYAELSGEPLLSWHIHEKTNWFFFSTSTMIPPIMNHVVLKSFLRTSKAEQDWVNHALDEAHQAAEFLANFDLDKAEAVLCGSGRSSSAMSSSSTSSNVSGHVTEPLRRLLSNLRSYKVFLPKALFSNDNEDYSEPPNVELDLAMKGKRANADLLQVVVERIRDRTYTLKDFQRDTVAAFPELALYDWNAGGAMSSGLNGKEEFQRTMSALSAVYALTRLDIDGKEVFSFGIEEDGSPRLKPKGDAAAKLQTFYDSMSWDRAQGLMNRAGVFENRNEKNSLHKDRFKVLLVLTAIHDVMKNTGLLPSVQLRHREYYGYNTGDTINDHDVALAYVLEHYPHLLPSYHSLEPSLRAPILFTQGKMGFNNGWLVQGEAPPGALFRQFKKIIVQGQASSADVNLYFVHWLTDLAGAEPYGERPWPGAEKFTLKFPVKVLSAFLDSFSHVDGLANSSETEVMESYIESRWEALGSPPPQVSLDSKPAAMRLALMAQGFEHALVKELECLPHAERQTLITELARTGCLEQFRNVVPEMRETLREGPVLLVYYAPALLQKAKAVECGEALRVLAAVMRAARILFPLRPSRFEDNVIIRIDALKVLTPAEIKQKGEWHLRKIGPTDAEVGAGWAAELLEDTAAKANLSKWGSKIAYQSGQFVFAESIDVTDSFAAADLDIFGLEEI